jgi:hypothetical protein
MCGVLEDQVRREPVLCPQVVQLLADEPVGLFGEGGALVEHAADFLLERPRAQRSTRHISA